MADYGLDIIEGKAGSAAFLEGLAVTQDGCYQSIPEGLIFPGWDGQSETWCPKAGWSWWMNTIFKAQDPKVLKISTTVGLGLPKTEPYYLLLFIITWSESDYEGTLQWFPMLVGFTGFNAIQYIDITGVVDNAQEHLQIELWRMLGESPGRMDSEDIALFNMRTLTGSEAADAISEGIVQPFSIM